MAKTLQPKELKITIDKDIPMPVTKSRFPFWQMEVGDSFEIPVGLAPNITSAAQQFGSSNKMKFSRRGNRIWRIK